MAKSKIEELLNGSDVVISNVGEDTVVCIINGSNVPRIYQDLDMYDIGSIEDIMFDNINVLPNEVFIKEIISFFEKNGYYT